MRFSIVPCIYNILRQQINVFEKAAGEKVKLKFDGNRHSVDVTPMTMAFVVIIKS